MAKADKSAAPAATDATAETEPPKKSKKMLFIIIGLVVLLVMGGMAAFLLLGNEETAKTEDKAAEHAKEAVSYVELGTFTANLIREEGDRYLQVAIALKLTKPDIEEKIKSSRPEILHRVNMLLQSKRPSDLATVEGRDLLAQEIKEQIEYVIGLRKVAPVIGNTSPEAVQGESAPSQTGLVKIRSDLAEVLFTSFIIQ